MAVDAEFDALLALVVRGQVVVLHACGALRGLVHALLAEPLALQAGRMGAVSVVLGGAFLDARREAQVVIWGLAAVALVDGGAETRQAARVAWLPRECTKMRG